jgi:hypothetical protein
MARLHAGQEVTLEQRIAVANLADQLDEPLLWLLAEDDDWTVRSIVAEKARGPHELFELLLKDPYGHLSSIVHNHNLSPDQLDTAVAVLAAEVNHANAVGYWSMALSQALDHPAMTEATLNRFPASVVLRKAPDKLTPSDAPEGAFDVIVALAADDPVLDLGSARSMATLVLAAPA